MYDTKSPTARGVKAGASAPAALTILLALGLAAGGCSNSSSRSGGAATATPGATTGNPSSGTSTGNTGGPPPMPASPASQGTALGVWNGELQALWDNLRPLVDAQVTQLASAQLAGAQYTSSAVDVSVHRVTAVTQGIAVAPGLQRMDLDRLELRVPAQGTWDLALEADIRVTLKLGGFQPAIDIPVTIEIKDLVMELEAEIDHADPTRPVMSRVGRPTVNFQVNITSSSSLVQNVTQVLTPVADWLVQRLLDETMRSLMPVLAGLQGVPGAVPAAGSSLLGDSGAATPFEQVAVNVDRKIRQHHLPHGTILCANMDTPATDSWLDAFRDGGSGIQGSVTSYHSGGDSAIWTGQYLASQAFRWAATQDPEALEHVRYTLAGVGALLDVNGGSGLLARVAAPENSLVGQSIVARGVFRSAIINGENWVGRQGGNGISRDQYSGVMFGLAITYELVDDPQVRAECQRRIEMILDYIIGHDWIIDEDRPAWTAGANSSRGPTFWLGINYQRLAFLHIGHRINPGKYSQDLAEAGPLSETAWFGLWTSTFGFDHYYKFNLAHVGLYNFFRLETDVQRWQDVHRGWRIMTRYMGHHRNAHFDLIRTTVDPVTRGDLFAQTREVMRRFLDRNHREVAPAVVDLSGVTFQQLTSVQYANVGGSVQVTNVTQSVPSEPLDLVLRRYTGNFHWQRDPFTPATPNAGNPRSEKHGLDVVLPYWMGRHEGGF
jgi:hypothetical protein